MKNHNNVSKNLVELVSAFPQLKENYNSLVGYYWVMYDHVKSAEDYANATPVETITRNFRKLVEQGKISLPERILEARKAKEKDYKHEFTTLG